MIFPSLFLRCKYTIFHQNPPQCHFPPNKNSLEIPARFLQNITQNHQSTTHSHYGKGQPFTTPRRPQAPQGHQRIRICQQGGPALRGNARQRQRHQRVRVLGLPEPRERETVKEPENHRSGCLHELLQTQKHRPARRFGNHRRQRLLKMF